MNFNKEEFFKNISKIKEIIFQKGSFTTNFQKLKNTLDDYLPKYEDEDTRMLFLILYMTQVFDSKKFKTAENIKRRLDEISNFLGSKNAVDMVEKITEIKFDRKYKIEKNKGIVKKVKDTKSIKDANKNGEFNGMKKLLKFLTNNGLDIDDDNQFGNSEPLLLTAVENNDIDVIKLLLNSGADIEATDYNSDTALIRACKNGNNIIARMLIDLNADVDAENFDWETPLSLAREKDNRYLVGLLRKAGATDEDDD